MEEGNGYKISEPWYIEYVCILAVIYLLMSIGDKLFYTNGPEIWIDRTTKCEYLIIQNGIAPRMNLIGMQRGCEWQNPDGSVKVLPDLEQPLPQEERILAR